MRVAASVVRSRPAALRLVLALVATTGLALAVAACGSSGEESVQQEGSVESKTGVDKKIAAMVPADLRKQHTLKVATAAAYPPETSINGSGEIVGSDPDLGKAIAKIMGLDFKFMNVTDTELIPGLEAGRYELVMTGAYVEPERLEQVDFITYQQGYTAFVAAAGAELPQVTGITSVCGLKIAVPTGSAEASFLGVQNQECRAKGKPIEIQQYGDQNQANLAVVSGRADLTTVDQSVANTVAKSSNGKLEVVGDGFPGPRIGAEVQKGSPLGPAVHAAFEKLMAGPEYKRILDHWGESKEAISETQLLTKPSETPTIEEILANNS